MLRIERSKHNDGVRFMLSGRIEAEHLPELLRLLDAEERGCPVILDLGEVKLVDHDAVRFLAECEAAGATLQGCALYVREWITRERARSRKLRRKTYSHRNREP